MRIHSIEPVAIDIPLTRNFGGATYSVLKRSTVITRLRTEDGLEAQVYNGDNRDHGPGIARIIRDVLAPIAVGMDIFDTAETWRRMFAATVAFADKKLIMEAIACVDCAVWDAVGRAKGKSVSAMLGADRPEVPIISIGGYYLPGKTMDEIAAEMIAYREAGMAGCKFKVGGLSPEEDAERTRIARQAAGDAFVLAVDANRGWSVEDAVRFAGLVQDLNIAWFEEPCHWYDDAAMMADVRRQTQIPISAGQSEITHHGVRRLINAGAVDLVNVDASETGGVTDWRRSADLCAKAKIRMGHHEESQIAIHLLSGVPHGTNVECFADPARDPVWQDLWVNRPPIRDGNMQVPTGPGFDIELDEGLIRKFRTG